MPLFDLPVEELRTYRPDLPEPADFDAFWDRTLAEARTYPLDVQAVTVDSGLRLVEVQDVTFAGFGGQPVKAWLTRPAGDDRDLPVVVEYQGYGGGRGSRTSGWAGRWPAMRTCSWTPVARAAPGARVASRPTRPVAARRCPG